jgi:hypothetical protein
MVKSVNWNTVSKELSPSVGGRRMGAHRLPDRQCLPLFGGQVGRSVRRKGNLRKSLKLGEEASMEKRVVLVVEKSCRSFRINDPSGKALGT